MDATPMAETLEERVAYLEGKVEVQSHLGGGLRERLEHLDQKVDRFRDELSSRIDAIDQRLSSRIDVLAGHITNLDQRLNSRIDAIDQKLSTQFRWLVGIMIAVLLSVIGVLLRFSPS